MECKICKLNKGFKLTTRKNNYLCFKCLNCNTFFISPQPSMSDLKKIYSFDGGYFTNTSFEVPNLFLKLFLNKFGSRLFNHSTNF